MILSKFGIASAILTLTPAVAAERNDGIKLVIGPTCGKLTVTGNVTDANRGLRNIKKYKTIVSISSDPGLSLLM